MTTAYNDLITGTAGVVSYWPLDETSGTTATDIVGAKNMTYAGGFSLAQGSPVSGTSVSFNGSTGKATVGSTLLTAVASVSLEAWFNCSNTAGGRAVIMFNGDGGSNGYGVLLNAPTSSDGRINVLYGGIAFTGPIPVCLVRQGAWYHLVFTLDAGKIPRIYINGALAWTDTAHTANAPTKCSIGTDLTGFFPGLIDEVAFYNAQLSSDQILAHYLAGLPQHATYYQPKPASSVVRGSLANGLQLAAPLCEGSGAPRNLIGRQAATINSGSFAWGRNQYGVGVDPGSSFGTNYLNWSHGAINHAGPWSAAALVTFRSFPTDSIKISSLWGTGTAGSGNQMYLRVRNFNVPCLTVGSTDTLGTAALGVNIPYLLAGTYDGVTARMYLDGVLVGSSSVTTPASALVNTSTTFHDDSGAGVPDCLLHGLYAWNRTLTDSEMAALNQDFFAPVRPKGIAALAFPSAGVLLRPSDNMFGSMTDMTGGFINA